MKTLQTGAKVLIEATVEATKDNDVMAVTKSAYLIRVDKSDLTVCETAEPIDLSNFCIDITDPVNAELLEGFKEWLVKNGHENIQDYFGGWKFFGKRQDHSVAEGFQHRALAPLTTLPELQNQHPGVFNQSDSEATPSFKAGQEVEFSDYPDFPEDYSVVMSYIGQMKDNGKHIGETPAGQIGKYIYVRPIPAQPTELIEGSICDYCDVKFHVDLMLPDKVWRRLVGSDNIVICPKCIGELFNKHYAAGNDFGAFELVDLSKHQKHSGRVEVSDKEILQQFDKIHEGVPHDRAVIATVRHFMTRKEAGK